MAIVTGDRYLEKLVKFVENQVGPLIDGTLVLKLNPAGLHYVQSRLESLQELERLLAGAPVDYLRAYVSDLGDHRALEQLRRILRLLTSLKVVSVLSPPARDPTPLSLLPFGRLRFLELRGCDLSTSAARGLLELRHTLEKLICHNSTDALRHIFASRIADIKKSPQWNRLSFVSCACNSMVLMDESLQLLPAVETLDLSRNRFSRVDNLRKCVKLKHVDLGFNNLRTISCFIEVSCNIVKLVLRNNALTSLHGIENLKSLEGLDVSYNLISSFSELEILTGLTLLQSFWLEGNPISSARWYRPQVFSLFSYPERLMLDNTGISTREYWKRQIIIASQQKQPSSFGFYSPAKADAECEGSIPRKKKKQSRLASIESEEESVCIFSDQESGSSHNEVPSKEENAGHDDEAEIVDLINRVELLKKERSILWLREVKEWMDQASENMNGTWDSVKVYNLLNATSQRHFGESSKYISDSVQASGDANGTTCLESDHFFAEKALLLHGQKYFDQLSAAGSNSGILLPGKEGMDIQEMCQSYSHELIKTVSEHVKAVHSEMLAPKKHHVVGSSSESPITALGNPSESHFTSASPGSPPHYQDDILYRRHSLVEEILKLSAESYSVASSDSDSSCSEDDLCEYGSSFSSVHHPSDPVVLLWNVDGRFAGSSYKGNCSYINGRIQHAGENGNCLADSLAEEAPNVVECSLQPNSDESLDSALADPGTESLQKRRGRRKPVKRVVSFSSEKEGARNSVIVRQSSVAMDFNGLEDEQEKEIHRESTAREVDEEQMQQDALGAGDKCSFKLADEFIEIYFKKIVTEARSSETCRHYLRCDCVLEQESIYREREVALVLSSERQLYVLLIGTKLDGSGTILSVLGSHMVEDVKEVYVSMGLQVVRICIGGGPTYVLIVRNMEKSRQLLGALQESEIHSSKKVSSLRSVESIQLELFSKHICTGSKANIFQYSMILFWENSNKEKSWSNRSLFVTRHHLLLCVEDIRKFSSLTRKSRMPPYFSLVLCCSIADVSEMVIEEGENGSVTLEVERFAYKFPPETNTKKSSSQDLSSRNITWKLMWSSETNLLQFVALLKALHKQTPSPLFVRCAS